MVVQRSVRAAQVQSTVAVRKPVTVVFPVVMVLGLVIETVVNQYEVPVVGYVVVPSNQIPEVIVVVYVIGLVCSVAVHMCVAVPHTVLVVPAGTVTVNVANTGFGVAMLTNVTVLV